MTAAPRATRIVGKGVVCGSGIGLPAFWNALCEGVPLQQPTSLGDTRLAEKSYVAIQEPLEPLGDLPTRWLDLVISMAEKEASRTIHHMGRHARCALLGGTSLGGMTLFESQHRQIFDPAGACGPGRPTSSDAAREHARYAGPHTAISMTRKFQGGVLSVNTACSSAANALGLAHLWLVKRRIDIAIVTGVDAISPFVYGGFAALGAIDPEPTRPFCAERRGLNLGEAAVAFVLVRDEDAASRQGCKLIGYGASCDAHHLTRPDLSGAGLARAMRAALENAATGPAEIAAISAHGTGTPYNDTMEAAAIVDVFGEHPPPVHCAKPVFGHTLGAAGAIDVLAMCLALEHNTLPATRLLGRQDPALRVHPADTNIQLPPGATILSTSSGFGGSNAALTLRGF